MGAGLQRGWLHLRRPFHDRVRDGLPILTTVAPQEYASNGYATGIDGGTTSMGIM
jgi:hypothetical protein